LNELNGYSDGSKILELRDNNDSIIPSEFKNNKVIMIENKDDTKVEFIVDKKKNKKKFDM
jgi:hypothetical protein